MPLFRRAACACSRGRPCEVATEGMRIRPGVIIVAPGDAHIRVVRMSRGRVRSGCRPDASRAAACPRSIRCSKSIAEVYGVARARHRAERHGPRRLRSAREHWSRRAAASWCRTAKARSSGACPDAVAKAGCASAVLPPDEIGRLIASRAGGAMLMPSANRPARRAMNMIAALLEERTGQQIAANRAWRIETALKPLLRERGHRDARRAGRAADARAHGRRLPIRWSMRCSTTKPASSAIARVLEQVAEAVARLARRSAARGGCGSGPRAARPGRSLFARDAVRRTRRAATALDARDRRDRRIAGAVARARAGAIRSSRSSAGFRCADDALVRQRRRRLGRPPELIAQGPVPPAQPRRRSAAAGPVRHHPVPQRPALFLGDAAARRCSTGWRRRCARAAC